MEPSDNRNRLLSAQYEYEDQRGISLLISSAKNIGKRALYSLGYYSLYGRLKAPAENRLLVVMYHDFVEDAARSDDWSYWGRLSRSEFEAHLAALTDHFRIVTLEDAIEEIDQTGTLQEKSAAITIDDGYLSSYTIAYPLLREYGVSATVYLPTDWIDRTMTPWWISLATLVKKCSHPRPCLDAVESVLGVSLGSNVRKEQGESLNRRALLHELESLLRSRDQTSIQRMLSELEKLLPGNLSTATPEEIPVTWDQVREMSTGGIRFGAHTTSHANLALVDLATAEAEIRNSKLRIEEQISTPVTGFAYPYGVNYSDYTRLKPLLEKYGFRYACTASTGVNSSDTDRFRLVRITLPLAQSPALIKRLLILDYLDEPTRSV